MTQINNIRFAFAVNEQNKFESKHFGDADKYVIYEWVNNKFNEISEEVNASKNIDESNVHGSKTKGNTIIDFLKQKGVKILVSKQFGKNINLVNQHFVPVMVKTENIQETIQELVKHTKWLEDELINKNDNYKLFKITSSVLKSNI